jgi:hypothetical protein
MTNAGVSFLDADAHLWWTVSTVPSILGIMGSYIIFVLLSIFGFYWSEACSGNHRHNSIGN